jgi:hypothetical protein
MGSWGPENDQTIHLLDRIPNARPLSSYRIIPIDRCYRQRGYNGFDECIFAFGRFYGSQIERCGFYPLNQFPTSDQLEERWREDNLEIVLIARGSLSPRAIQFDVAPPESLIEELLVRSFAARQTRDYGNYAQASVYLQGKPFRNGYTIKEVLKPYGYVVPSLQ